MKKLCLFFIFIFAVNLMFGAALTELFDDSPVPVTMSSFNAAVVQNSFVSLNWVTQSKNGVIGYLIFRSFADFDSAGSVSDLIPATNTTQQHNYNFIDYEVSVGVTYNYWLQGIEQDGSTTLWGPHSAMLEEQITPQLPTESFLKNNYPNPFNPLTKITFSIKEGETGSLTIYNSKGQQILQEDFESGEYKYEWNANDFSSGIYFYSLFTPSSSSTRKMILMK